MTLEDQAARFMSAFEHAAIGMSIVSPEGRWLEVNWSLCAMIGYSEAELLATTFQQLTHPDDLDIDLDLLRRLLRGDLKSYQVEKRYLHKDGRVVWGLLNVSAVRDSSNRVKYFVSQIQDVTAQKRAAAKLRQRSEFHRQLVELVEASLMSDVGPYFYQCLLEMAVAAIPGAQVGTMLLRDEQRSYRFVAAVGYDLSLLKTTFLHEHELFLQNAGTGPQLLRTFDNSALPRERLEPILNSGPSDAIKVVLAIPVYLAGEPLAYVYLDNLADEEAFDEDALQMAQLFGQQVAAVWQRLKLEGELREQRRAFEYLALHDRLTGLPNRTLLDDRLSQAVTQAQRRNSLLAVIFVDLDDFKHVNDTCGHKTGDLLLEGVARRLSMSVRMGDTVARWGGDEFVILLSNLAHAEDVMLVADKILSRFAEPL